MRATRPVPWNSNIRTWIEHRHWWPVTYSVKYGMVSKSFVQHFLQIKTDNSTSSLGFIIIGNMHIYRYHERLPEKISFSLNVMEIEFLESSDGDVKCFFLSLKWFSIDFIFLTQLNLFYPTFNSKNHIQSSHKGIIRAFKIWKQLQVIFQLQRQSHSHYREHRKVFSNQTNQHQHKAYCHYSFAFTKILNEEPYTKFSSQIV